MHCDEKASRASSPSPGQLSRQHCSTAVRNESLRQRHGRSFWAQVETPTLSLTQAAQRMRSTACAIEMSERTARMANFMVYGLELLLKCFRVREVDERVEKGSNFDPWRTAYADRAQPSAARRTRHRRRYERRGELYSLHVAEAPPLMFDLETMNDLFYDAPSQAMRDGSSNERHP